MGGFKSVELDPLTMWNIFYYFFRNFLHGDTDERVDLGNKERPSVIVLKLINSFLLAPKSDCVEFKRRGKTREKRVKKKRVQEAGNMFSLLCSR